MGDGAGAPRELHVRARWQRKRGSQCASTIARRAVASESGKRRSGRDLERTTSRQPSIRIRTRMDELK